MDDDDDEGGEKAIDDDTKAVKNASCSGAMLEYHDETMTTRHC